ncbi:stage III sporulation protein AE [uncultured Dysosmobacter sp.]|uniref:stage III sporulation protein AE n=1 Tax=uncultured Dysosmobacter sp. TaxID=2591384 RepID=UPI00262EFEAB|nr:stage III sporulation protein AE [uncultured Dysosmobacter sp.]
MKRAIICLLAAAALTVSARAAEVPEELTEALPRGAEELLEDADFSGVQGFSGGVDRILEAVSGQVGTVLRQRVKGAASVLLVVVLCGAVDGFSQSAGGRTAFLPMVGALSVTMATAGSLDTLIGLGAETIDQLHLFSQALLPTLAAATAASGAVTTAAFHQVAAVFAADLLLQLIDGLLLPLVYLYIGVLTAASCLPENRLGVLAEGLKKGISWLLTAGLLLFTGYLSMARVVSGTVDGAAVKLTKAAISGAVPVVGGVISEAAETVLAGAGMLKSTVGLFGMLAILAACAYPFLQLGIQYLLYKLTAALAAVVGAPGLCKLIDGLGGAFGLVLGMTGSCALVLLISIISSVAAVMP